ncbi:hypothetical protein Thein_0204 [Thermodesulfatator indicus DSM 15286]|uniref:Prepilin-type N-terminal cleavage/methylation domain-containing protein n=1 Tax=Thermodesulfatator indicus (strain DSM 15286 / JCM 11887 / CIR29812) TaxID=667014 RepID=F8A9E8_THEID|nr:prepilin-type N-terminal cleavage/methylation domain-containing protein [Thermodesulfatator indicus]AEH44089.1 hypothetical protein Thein_0204 [Thermodesulfatator indicus DSM 15286]
MLRERREDHRKMGFSLIELLIVVAIIAILAAIAIPQYNKYVKKVAAANVQAVLSACLSEAMAQYADKIKTEYTCKLQGDNGLETVTIELDDNGNLSSLSTTNFEVKGHAVQCTAHTDTNTITCDPA